MRVLVEPGPVITKPYLAEPGTVVVIDREGRVAHRDITVPRTNRPSCDTRSNARWDGEVCLSLSVER